MDSKSWEQIKSNYKLGPFVLGKVEFHAPFGVFIGEMGLKPRASSTALYYNKMNTAGHTGIHA
jgi:hypothetical protein